MNFLDWPQRGVTSLVATKNMDARVVMHVPLNFILFSFLQCYICVHICDFGFSQLEHYTLFNPPWTAQLETAKTILQL